MKLYTKILKLITDIRLYKWGIILTGDSTYEIKGPHLRELLNVIQPGDVLLRKYKHYIGNMIIPGYWAHAAIYVGANKTIHVRGDGILIEDILTFTRADDLMVLRCADNELINHAISEAYKYLEKGMVYDYKFDFDNPDAMSCTEFIDVIFKHPKIERTFNKYILPDDLLNSIFKVVWKKN